MKRIRRSAYSRRLAATCRMKQARRSGKRTLTFKQPRRKRRLNRRVVSTGLTPVRRPPQTVRLDRVSAIVVGVLSPDAIGHIRDLTRIPILETIVVLDGRDPSLAAMIRAQTEAIVVFMPELLGPDEDRSVGVSQAKGDTLLFVSGHSPVDLSTLSRLIAAVEQGADVALVDRGASLGTFRQWGEADRVRAFMNSALDRAWLGPNSLDHLPHAWSRAGLERIGEGLLAIPARALAAAITTNLQVKTVPLHASNARRGLNRLDAGAGGGLRLGDHVEALVSVMQRQGGRLQWLDQVRRRGETGGDQS